MAAIDLPTQLRQFVQDHASGWKHDEWLGLLFQLSESGFDTVDEAGIGLALEHERLVQTLAKMDIKGLGPKRIEALADHFGTLWNLMDAPPEAVAEAPGVPSALAHRIIEVLQ